MSLRTFVAAASALAGRWPPRAMVAVSLLLVTAGLAAAGVGFGLGNTGSVGILLQSVSAERIVTAMVVWSQIGILGYLPGPLVGSAVAEGLGFAALGLVPLVGGAVLVVALLSQSRTPAPA